MKSFSDIFIDEEKVKWHFGTDSGILENISRDGYLYDDWSPGKDVSVEVRLEEFELSEEYRSLCAAGDIELGFVLSWYCNETSLRGVLEILETDFLGPFEPFSMYGTVSGMNLAGSITFSLTLVVLRSEDERRISAGLKVGEVSRTVIVEGRVAQFPVQIISFKDEEQFRPYRNSLYVLERDLSCSELEDLFYNTYVLYLNSNSPYISILNGKKAEAGTPERAVLDMLITSVYSDIIIDISQYFEKRPGFRFDDWIDPRKSGKKIPEMLGRVFYNIVQQVAVCMHRSADFALQYIVKKPYEARNYIQSAIFMEKK